MHNRYTVSGLLAAIMVMSLTVSCKKNNNPITEITCDKNESKPIFNTNNYNDLVTVNYETKVCGLMPLGKSFKWIYKDSIFDNNGQFSSIKMDTLVIEKTVRSAADNSVFWKMKSTRLKGLQNYIYTTDSIMYCLDVLYSNNKPFAATEWLKINSQDSVRKISFLSDMGYIETVKKLKTNVTVPAGTYSNCIYNIKSIDGIEEIIYKPELGIIKYTKYSPYGNPFNPTPADKRQVSELVAFLQ